MKKNWGLWVAVALVIGVAILAVSTARADPRERIAIDTSTDSLHYFGADDLYYSDEYVTLKARIEGGTGDLYTAGAIDVRGTVSDGGGTLTLDDDVAVTGALAVTGASTFGDLTVNGNLVVTGTSDLQGNVGDSAGTFTIADNAQVTGTLDVLGDLSDSAGTFTIADAAQVTGTLDVLGDLSDSGGDLVINDPLDLKGALYDGSSDLVLMDIVDIQGEIYDSTGDLTIADAVLITSTLQVDGQADLYVLVTVHGDTVVTGTLEAQGGIYNSSADLQLSDDVDITGNVHNSTGTLTIVDATQITGTLDLLGNLADSVGDVTIDDNLDLKGYLYDGSSDLVLMDIVDIQGDVYDSTGTLTFADAAQITSTLDVLGAVSDSGGDLQLNDTVDITGDVYDSGGVFTIDDSVQVNSTLEVDGDTTLNSDVMITADGSGGDKGAMNTLAGLLQITLAGLGTGHDGTAETVLYVDNDADGEWTAISTTVTVSGTNVHYRVGTESLGLAFSATAEDGDGAVTTIVTDDLEANESIGFWIMSDTALDAGDLDILLNDDDASPDPQFEVCAVTAGSWQWCEVDISTLAGGDGDTVDEVSIILQDEAGLGAFEIWIDGMYKWDADDEDALNHDILVDGVLGLSDAAAGTTLALYTDFFVNYQSGNDMLVWISNQSAALGVALVAY